MYVYTFWQRNRRSPKGGSRRAFGNERTKNPSKCGLSLSLRRLGVKSVEIRKPEQLQDVTSLIIPGGESTTMAKLAEYHNLFPALREFVKIGKPVWGTCAGLIFLANKAVGQKTGGQELIGGLDCTVHRNFFGSQIQSFEEEISVPELASSEGGPETFRGIFIRAPAILEVGPEVQVLADYTVPSNRVLEENVEAERKVIIAVRQGSILATAFHPELTADTRWHSYFLKMTEDTGETEEASSNLVPIQVDLSSASYCLFLEQLNLKGIPKYVWSVIFVIQLAKYDLCEFVLKLEEDNGSTEGKRATSHESMKLMNIISVIGVKFLS
ncbi:putative pyridoxal 5'-phosphate synthase subunit PDX2 [Senna tora]|uniref:glutaminase n=1 Tax=Senna tora TaxID=362788 RepID=A0A834SMU5_9FABA|nr:putative pyridoxal 5'-phosphate synthase subunit PDX2 [Senna tora]